MSDYDRAPNPFEIREWALTSAVRLLASSATTAHPISLGANTVAVARKFEAYLAGDKR
jgi:hypothetical protein